VTRVSQGDTSDNEPVVTSDTVTRVSRVSLVSPCDTSDSEPVVTSDTK